MTKQEQHLVDQARRDLQERFGFTEDSVCLRRVEAVQWPDASLGCPEPGKAYATVIVPGYRIVLEAHGRQFDYRSDGRQVRLCQERGE